MIVGIDGSSASLKKTIDDERSMCRAHVRCTSVATRVSCIEPPVSTLYTMRGGVASAAPASQRSGCGGKDGSTEGSGVSGIAAGSDGAWSWTSGGAVGMMRCCTGAMNKCAASRRPAAATTKRVATARIIRAASQECVAQAPVAAAKATTAEIDAARGD